MHLAKDLMIPVERGDEGREMGEGAASAPKLDQKTQKDAATNKGYFIRYINLR